MKLSSEEISTAEIGTYMPNLKSIKLLGGTMVGFALLLVFLLSVGTMQYFGVVEYPTDSYLPWFTASMAGVYMAYRLYVGIFGLFCFKIERYDLFNTVVPDNPRDITFAVVLAMLMIMNDLQSIVFATSVIHIGLLCLKYYKVPNNNDRQ